jgi:hypothetical protein
VDFRTERYFAGSAAGAIDFATYAHLFKLGTNIRFGGW